MPLSTIEAELEANGIKNRELCRMHSKKTKKNIKLILVTLPEHYEKIYNLRNLSGYFIKLVPCIQMSIPMGINYCHSSRCSIPPPPLFLCRASFTQHYLLYDAVLICKICAINDTHAHVFLFGIFKFLHIPKLIAFPPIYCVLTSALKVNFAHTSELA